MKNFNISGVYSKIKLKERGSRKTNIDERKYLKRGAWTICRFKGGLAWQERQGSVFDRGFHIPM